MRHEFVITSRMFQVRRVVSPRCITRAFGVGLARTNRTLFRFPLPSVHVAPSLTTAPTQVRFYSDKNPLEQAIEEIDRNVKANKGACSG